MQPPPLQIRRFNQQDTDAAIALWRECGLVRPPNDPHRDIAAKLAFQPELFLVAELAAEVVGSVMAGYEGHRGWINYLAVKPALQRSNYGAQLMQAAEELLRPLGCQKINLQVRTNNTAVLGFYEKIGYKPDDVVSLGKRLD